MPMDSFGARAQLHVGPASFEIVRLDALDAIADVGRLPFSVKVLLENLLRHEDGATVTQDRRRGPRPMGTGVGRDTRDRLRPRPRAHAGLHRCARHRRPRRDARRHGSLRSRSGQDRPARARGADRRPLGDRRRIGSPGRVSSQRRAGVHPQPRALRAAAVGAGRVRQRSRHAARLGHLPPGQPRVPGSRGVRRRRRVRLPGHARRHRLPHADGQRAGRARLGGGRDRGGGGHARRAALAAAARGRRGPARRRAPGGVDRHRPRAHHRRAAAPPRRGRQVRRVLRAGRRRGATREPGDHRQHVSRVRLHLRHVPDRRGDPPLSPIHRPPARADRAGRGLRQGARALPRTGRVRPDLLRDRRARPRDGGAQHRRPGPPARPSAAHRRQTVVSTGAGREPVDDERGVLTAAVRTRPPRSPSRPATHRHRTQGGRTRRAGPQPRAGAVVELRSRCPSVRAAPPPPSSPAATRSRSTTATSSSPPSPAARTRPTPRSWSPPGCWRRRRWRED